MPVMQQTIGADRKAEDRRDVVILGGGLVGLTLAIGLSQAGISSHVVDRADPAAQLADGFDGRASAISTASWNMFCALGLDAKLAGKGCTIGSIWVSDGLKPGALDFTPRPEDGTLGMMFANRDVRRALYDAAMAEPLLAFHPLADVVARYRDGHGVAVVLADGRRLAGSLLVGAEGRKSPTREAAGLQVARWEYHHRAIISGLIHAKPHGNVAYEIFYPAGPFALLPMLDDADGRHRSALVWTVPERDGDAVVGLSDRAFLAEVEKRMGGMLGDVQLGAPRTSYPLGFHHTARITADRLALVGDAAHGLHPIAGQGFNLGLRDAAALIEVLRDGAGLGLDTGDAQLLARYEAWRGLDSFSVALATDVLTRLFGIPGKPASAIRRIGMAAIQRTPPLKRLFMNEARGTSGKLPALLRG